MAVPRKHLLHQVPVIASLGQTALSAVTQRLHPRGQNPSTPTPELVETIAPRPRDLIAAYLRNVGGDPGAYKGRLPPHFFPQWGFPLAAKTLRDIRYPLAKVLNGGCRIEMNRPLPADRPLRVRARLESIDDDGRRAVLKQRVITETDDAPEALVAYLYAIVPLGKRDPAEKKERPRVPEDVREIAYFRLSREAGLDFAFLTGDFNPVHWIQPYAHAMGFKSTILHGFATMARAYEGLVRGLFAGDPDAIATFDVKFTRPLLLPAKVGLYVGKEPKNGHGASGPSSDLQVFVGDAPSGPQYLAGTVGRKR